MFSWEDPAWQGLKFDYCHNENQMKECFLQNNKRSKASHQIGKETWFYWVCHFAALLFVNCNCFVSLRHDLNAWNNICKSDIIYHNIYH